MNLKNKIMIISLIILLLLSVTCVSATQDINDNSTMETNTYNIEEVTSSQDTGDMEVHSTETELKNDDNMLETDGGDTIGEQDTNEEILESDSEQIINEEILESNGEQAISYDVIEADSDSIDQEIESYIRANKGLLGISNDDNDVLQYTKYLNYDQLPNFSGITFVVGWYQQNLDKDGIYLIFTNERLKLITSLGEPLTIEGGRSSSVEWKLYFDIRFNGQRSVFDGLGKSALVNVTKNSNYVLFKDIEFTNSVDGGVFVDTDCRSTMEFENCVFRNITGGAIVVNSASNIIIRNCTFENLSSDSGSAINIKNEDASLTISDSKFVNTKAGGIIDASNTGNNIVTMSFKSKENYISAIHSQGNVQLNNVEYWDSTRMVNTNNVPSTNTLKNKTVVMTIKTKEGNVSYTLKTDDDGEAKFNYTDFVNRYGHGSYDYELSFSGDNYTFPTTYNGYLQTRGEFGYLQELINNAAANDTIKLDSNVIYNTILDSIVEGIIINKPITIDGNGYAIDAMGLTRIFDIQSNDVTIKNITLLNGIISSNDGGAIRMAGSNCKIENATFMYNEAISGAAIAISSGENDIIANCFFIGNKAVNNGGAIFISNSPRYTKIGQNSRFINNSAGNGGAIYDYGSETTINSSDFISNSASKGGAIFKTYYALNLANSNFTGNIAERGGAIYVDGYATSSIQNSSFEENRANFKEFIVVDEPAFNRLNITFIGEENYIHAIYADGMAEVRFNNVSYWENGWKNTDETSIAKSNIGAFQNVTIIVFDKDSEQYLIEEYTTDSNGQLLFWYNAFDDGNYTYNLQHIEDAYYAFGEKNGTIEVKPGTFTDLQNLIEQANEGDVINLTKDYIYSPEVDGAITEGIEINKRITINGYGNTIDAKGQTRIFKVMRPHVTMTGIIFENGKNIQGSVAYFDSGDIKVNNCIFVNNPGPVVANGGGYGFDFNDNWFGNDWTNYNEKPSALGDFDVDRWYFLNITLNTKDAFISLNSKYIKSQDKIVIDDNCQLPPAYFIMNATDNIKFEEDVDKNIALYNNTTIPYSVGELGHLYRVPIGLTLNYKDKSFTQTRVFEHELHAQGIPEIIAKGDVASSYYITLTDTFGEGVYGTVTFTMGSYTQYIESQGGISVDIRRYYEDGEGDEYIGLKIDNYTYSIFDGRSTFTGNYTVVGEPDRLDIEAIGDSLVGEAKNLTIAIYQQKSSYMTYGTMTVTINGNATTFKIGSNEIKKIDISNYPYGEYNVTVEYHDNWDNFYDRSANMTFRVLKYESKINVDAPDNLGYQEELTFKIDVTNQTVATYRLANSNNETITEGEVDEDEVIVPGYLLTCGVYTLTVNNEETDTVYASTLIKNITVNKVTPTMLVNYTIDGNDVNITVDIDSDATGGILFNNEYVALVNGHASYKKQFEGGYHIVNVTYQTDRADVFNQVNKSLSLYIVNSTSTLKDTPIEVIAELAGNYVFLTAKVNETATGLVMFSINGSSVFMPIINGEAHHYDILDAGTYNVLVTYTGDSIFNGNSTVKTIVVNDPIKKNTTITPKVDIDGNNVEITINVNENATGYVAFTIDGNTYNVELFLGEAVFKGKFDEGNHVIDVEYLGDDEFESNSTTVNFTVEKTPLRNTTVELATRINERTLELLMTFDEETNGFAMIDINGTETYVKVDGGFAHYETVLEPGDYNITVTYLGDEKFNPAETSNMISIEKPAIKDANLNLSVVVSGAEVYILIDIDPDATGSVILEINDTATSYDLKGSNEPISFATILPLGTYEIIAAYTGDEYYDFDMQSEIIEIVPSLNTTIEARSDVNENTVTITVEVDANATGFVEFEIAGNKYYAPIIDSKATFTNNYDVGSYSVKVTYLGDERFKPANTTCQFIITEEVPELKNTTIDADIEVDGNAVIITAKVNETANGLIAFDIDGKILYLPVNNGEAVGCFVLPIGNYIAQITYMGDSQFNSAQLNKSFEVTEDTKVETLMEFIFNKNATGNITATVNGVNYTAEIIDGTANLTITNLNISGDEIKFNFDNVNINELIKVLVDGVEYEVPLNNGTASVETNRIATVIEYEDMVTKTIDTKIDGRNGKYFTFTLKDANGKPMANTPMKIGFNGVIYDEKNGIVTDENGTAKLQINLGYKGVYTFAICYLGDEKYNASFAVAKITVNLQTPTLTVPNKSYKAAAKSKVLTATLKDSYGKLVPNKQVTFTVNGKTYKATTNAKGVASVKVSLSAKKTYKFTVKLAESSVYSAVTKTAKVVIK